MLARYHRWAFENNKEESVIAFRTWIQQEAEFQTIASETVRGLTGKLVNTSSSRPARYGNQQTFFGEIKTFESKNGFIRNAEGSMGSETAKASFIRM